MDDHLNNLYEADTLIWTETQIALLRAGKFDQLDVENIISELGHQVRKDKNEIASRLRGLMTHLLKYQFQPLRRSRSWVSTIIEHRSRILDILERMPSLRPQLDDYVKHNYPRALMAVANETHMSPALFPQENPYSLDQLLNENFFPEDDEKDVRP
ncbi:hypothetical protein FHW83_001148 [Duganella sp. SG902]|uniref:DUF29 domain-containing protein n=1 Tax=Duganella sp. SG902 TaxID=2587016 RepID=UPI00159E237E|nr:DUF29 domain-containing protein [Duganella sp. SG902]NVM75368.1 hypothetical protein [Duganella sp. SG902]